MCGIAGIWGNNFSDCNETLLSRMTNSISHRGPDGEGKWFSENYPIALGHRRLSIIDLSENGHQPMHFIERYVITFNGEIYNYLEIKEKLIAKGFVFHTQSDTEVILASYHYWREKCLNEFDGMFAFAIYDKDQNELFCARDRFGEKPFYYSFCNGNFLFGSEMKALWSYGVPKDHNQKMLFQFLVNDLVENPADQKETFYRNIFKLKSAHYFIFKGDNNVNQKNYWQIDISKYSEMEPEKVSGKFLDLLETSVKRRLRSDVSLGSSLSGGLDSSTIVALISKLSNTNHTFSARFRDFQKDEGKYIEIISTKFDTNHHDVFVDENQLVSELDKLIWHQEEPFQTGSIYAQWCVYKEARKNNITVMLDGQGADEYLGGYDKDFKPYLKEIYRNKKLSKDFISSIKINHSIDVALTIKDQFSVLLPDLFSVLTKYKHKLIHPTLKGIDGNFANAFSNSESPFKEFSDLKSTLQYEMMNQGLEKLLKFADRNSMAQAVEVRLPFLFHELVEFVFSLKSSLFFEGGWSKAILRNSVQNILPSEIVRRRDKVGFEAPHDQWLNNPIFKEIYQDSFDYLYRNKILTKDYDNKWKTIIAAKYLLL